MDDIFIDLKLIPDSINASDFIDLLKDNLVEWTQEEVDKFLEEFKADA